MTDSRDNGGTTGGGGRRREGSRRRLGTPRPEWGDNVIQADFGSRGRRPGSGPAGTSAPEDATRATGGRGSAARDSGGRGPGARGGRQAAVPDTDGWAGQVILDTVARTADTARQSRGRTYHRSGNVLRTELEPGSVTALVSGSQLEPFEVSLRWRELTGNQLSYLRGEFLDHPDNLTRLLAGRAPRGEVAVILLSPDSFRDSWCTCPDQSGMCKHRIAVAHALAETFTSDPVAFLDWRGLETRRLIDEVREVEQRRRTAVVDLSGRRGAVEQGGGAGVEDGGTGDAVSGDAAASGDTGADGDGETARFSPEEFWGDPSRVPQWTPLDLAPGLELGDHGLRDAAIRKVSWNTVDQLHVLDELEHCYRLLTGEDSGDHVFDNEPWVTGPSGASGRIGDHD